MNTNVLFADRVAAEQRRDAQRRAARWRQAEAAANHRPAKSVVAAPARAARWVFAVGRRVAEIW